MVAQRGGCLELAQFPVIPERGPCLSLATSEGGSQLWARSRGCHVESGVLFLPIFWDKSKMGGGRHDRGEM